MPTLTDADKVLRNDVGKRMATALETIAQGSGGASVVQKTMAEYTALPSSEKMNGSIYKITDKALIYCLDEEYHAVKELTSAQYEALTTAEKNNGTLYIQTDAETTGEDIPVNTLTPNTSINSAINACFGRTAADIPYSSGVSVADKLDSLSTVKTGTFTAGTNIIVLRSSLYKIGNIKFLSVIFRVTDTSASAVGTVSTGFEATYNIDFTAMSDSNSYGRFRIQGGRNSVDISTTPQNNSYYAFTISYI